MVSPQQRLNEALRRHMEAKVAHNKAQRALLTYHARLGGLSNSHLANVPNNNLRNHIRRLMAQEKRAFANYVRAGNNIEEAHRLVRNYKMTTVLRALNALPAPLRKNIVVKIGPQMFRPS
jgi:hypothetical protein